MMKRSTKFFIFLLLLGAMYNKSVAQAPVNDDCSGAISLTIGTPVTDDNTDATDDDLSTLSSCGSTSADYTFHHGVWYTVTPSSDGLLTIASCESTFDTYLRVYEGTCDNFTCVDYNDDGCSSQSTISFAATSGTTYYIFLAGYHDDDYGEYTISATLTLPPANDDCSGAIAFPAIPTDGTCASVTANTAGATQSMEGCAGTADDDVWYSFVCPAGVDSLLFENTDISGNSDRVIEFFSGDCDNLTSLNCSDPESGGVGGLTPGNTYYFRIYTYGSGNSTEVSVCLKTVPSAPANDDCSGATTLTVNPDYNCGTVTNGTTESATASDETDPDCGSSGTNDDVWYSFVATNTDHRITLQNVSGSTDMAMAAYSGTCGNLTEIDCSDPNTLDLSDLTIGDTYFIRVWTWSSTAATHASFDICVGTPPPPPDNDNCSSATSITSFPYSSSEDASSASQTDFVTACPTGMNDGVWYQIEGTGCLMTVEVDPDGWDPAVGIFSGDCSDLECITRVDDAGSSGTETATFNTVAGTTYFINVGYYSSSTDGSEGPFDISVTEDCCPIPTSVSIDDITSSSVTVTWQGGANSILEYGPAGFTPGTGATAGTDGTAVTVSGGSYEIDDLDPETDYDVYIRSDCGSSTYSDNSDVESFTTSALPPDNDNCANATDLPCGGTLTGNNSGATDDDIPAISCGSTSAGAYKAVWYTITPAASGDMTISTCGSDFDTYLRVFEGTCDNFTDCAGYNDDDDNCDNNNSTATFTAVAGTTYYILLGGYGSSSYGAFTITSTCPVPPPVDSVVVNTDGNVPATITTDDGTLQIDATVYPSDADQSVTWSIIQETGNATIDANGLVTAMANGTVWAKAVSVSDNTMADSIEITISNQIIPVDSIVVSTDGNVAATITTDNGTLQLDATVYPAEADQSVTWSIIPQTGNATIDANGLVTAMADGTVWAKAISVSDNTMADSIEITISNQVIAVDSVVVSTEGNVPAAITTGNGILQLNATIYPSEADQSVTWSIIPATGNASIDATGLVTAMANGTVWAKAVSVADNTIADSIEITISNQPATPDSVVVGTDANLPPVITTVGGTLLMNAIVFPIDADQDVTWSIVPVTGNASITSGGLVTAIDDGTVWAKAVSVFDTTKSDSLLVTINQSTGVKQIEEAIGFKLYPNPTDYSLNIVIAKPHPELTVTITDASGREVARKHYASNELNTPQQVSVAQLAAGAYFLSINGNGINFSTQFIKQ